MYGLCAHAWPLRDSKGWCFVSRGGNAPEDANPFVLRRLAPVDKTWKNHRYPHVNFRCVYFSRCSPPSQPKGFRITKFQCSGSFRYIEILWFVDLNSLFYTSRYELSVQ